MKRLSYVFLLMFLEISLESHLNAEIFPIEFSANSDLRQFIPEGISLRTDGKFYIPSSIQHIKLDIGLSYSAPMSQNWLSNEENLMVFGFEPNPMAVNSILTGAVKRHPSHGTPLEINYIGNSFFLIPCALGNLDSNTVQLYVTKEDCGCSSIYYPKSFEIESTINIPIFKLSDFFDLFPFDTHPIIEYIKIDAQGSDLDIAKSAGNYLKERVVYITIEAENSQYENTNNSTQEIDDFMRDSGFVKYHSESTQDPTYINSKFIEYAKNHKIKIFQHG